MSGLVANITDRWSQYYYPSEANFIWYTMSYLSTNFDWPMVCIFKLVPKQSKRGLFSTHKTYLNPYFRKEKDIYLKKVSVSFKIMLNSLTLSNLKTCLQSKPCWHSSNKMTEKAKINFSQFRCVDFFHPIWQKISTSYLSQII